MVSPVLQNLEKLIGTPRDGALLRYSIGNEYLKRKDAESAAKHFSAAVCTAGDDLQSEQI